MRKQINIIKCTECGWIGLSSELLYNQYDYYEISLFYRYMTRIKDICPNCKKSGYLFPLNKKHINFHFEKVRY